MPRISTASRVAERVRRRGVARKDDAQAYVSTMFEPSSPGGRRRGPRRRGTTAAKTAAVERMVASRVSAGVRRRGVARNNDDAKIDDVYNVCTIIGEERGRRGSAGGGFVDVTSGGKKLCSRGLSSSLKNHLLCNRSCKM